MSQLKMPERVRRDWNSAPWGRCDNCGQRARVIDGICPACYDADYQSERESAYQTELSRLRELVKEMREALHTLEVSANSVAYCYSNRPENFAASLVSLRDDAEHAREVTAKADALLKEHGEPAKYGCHKNAQVTSECAIDINSPLCLVARVLSRKEDCSHWKPIK